MKLMRIEGTDSTPFIQLDPDKHFLEIRGESMPENTFEFYGCVTEWIETYMQQTTAAVIMEIELSYFNSSSSKVLMDLLDLLNEKAEEGRSVTVNWIFDEENDILMEHGEEFAEDMEHMTFNLVPTSS